MTTYKVLRRFRDKEHPYPFYNKGDSYSHENEERVASLIKGGFLQDNKSKKTTKSTAEKKSSTTKKE